MLKTWSASDDDLDTQDNMRMILWMDHYNASSCMMLLMKSLMVDPLFFVGKMNCISDTNLWHHAWRWSFSWCLLMMISLYLLGVIMISANWFHIMNIIFISLLLFVAPCVKTHHHQYPNCNLSLLKHEEKYSDNTISLILSFSSPLFSFRSCLVVLTDFLMLMLMIFLNHKSVESVAKGCKWSWDKKEDCLHLNGCMDRDL